MSHDPFKSVATNFYLVKFISSIFIIIVLFWGDPSLLESINKLIWECAEYIGRQ